MQNLFNSFSVAAMGFNALEAHTNSAKHKEHLPKKGSIVFFTQKECATKTAESNLIKVMYYFSYASKGSSFKRQIDLVIGRCCSEQLFF